ncbi:MAG: TlyA family RNA methyltransferase [bacterium]|nr:TlyA family RNA methyltransferase [bacterium]
MARRRLDAELVRRKLAASRSAAQAAIASGEVEVDGIVATKAASQVEDRASIRFVGEPARFVSRGGLKLDGALDQFDIVVAGRDAIDVGASTGGFTDCLLQRGATRVTALDVGYGQLDWKIRQDDRVAVIERVNARHMTPESVGGPFDLVVADLSFISLRTVAASLLSVGTNDADWILLVKPQFEAGREQVGKGGIVRDVAVRAEALDKVISTYRELGLGAHGVVDSPITGTKGNREFLIWLRRGKSELGADRYNELEGLGNA